MKTELTNSPIYVNWLKMYTDIFYCWWPQTTCHFSLQGVMWYAIYYSIRDISRTRVYRVPHDYNHVVTRLKFSLPIAYLYVSHPMIIKVGWSRESFPANRTLMWFLATMNSSMSIQRAGSGKPFSANIAHMRFFTWNQISTRIVVRQSMFKFRFTLFTSVRAYMTFQQRWTIECFTAHLTGQKSPFTVSPRHRLVTRRNWQGTTIVPWRVKILGGNIAFLRGKDVVVGICIVQRNSSRFSTGSIRTYCFPRQWVLNFPQRTGWSGEHRRYSKITITFEAQWIVRVGWWYNVFWQNWILW